MTSGEKFFRCLLPESCYMGGARRALLVLGALILVVLPAAPAAVGQTSGALAFSNPIELPKWAGGCCKIP